MKIVFAPDWFLKADVMIEAFSFIILLAFFILSIKNYKLSKNKKTLHLGIGFFLIAFAELATILTKMVLYYDTTFTQNIGQMVVTYNVVKTVDIFYKMGFFFHRLLTLLGLYLIYRIPKDRRLLEDFLLFFFFIVISSLFSNSYYYVFHITALLLLISITSNYIRVYRQNKSKNTIMLISAFSLLAISCIIFIFSKIPMLYVIAQLIQLASYIIMLFLIISILKYSNSKSQKNPKDNDHKSRGSKKSGILRRR